MDRRPCRKQRMYRHRVNHRVQNRMLRTHCQTLPPEQILLRNPLLLLAQPTEAARAATVRPGGIPRAVSASAKEASSETTDDSLEEVGKKYLYGTGVPQDCARAQSSLLTAAENSNVKAESVLGAMYATGHCVIRDLPLSYRWFARALQQEPRNPRIEQDIAVIWHQMTPQEQQLAMHSGQ